MPLFAYKAYDEDGKEVSGVIDSTNTSSARSQLKEKNLIPFEVKLEKAKETVLGSSDNLGLAEQVRFARQISALLKGGIPLTSALSGLENQEAWKKYRTKLVTLREKIEKGQDLSDALKETGNMFEPSSLAVIKVGETTGKLDYAFAQLSAHLNREMEHRRRFVAAIAYPLITAIISVGVLSFLMVYLVPTISKMFANVQGKLPWITRLLIVTSNFFRTYWVWGILSFILLAFFFKVAIRVKSFKRQWESLLLKIPIFGKFTKGMQMESWVRNSGMMIRCGVTLLESVKVMKDNTDSILQSDALTEVENLIEHGSTFSDALKKTGHFPNFLIQMIEAGEISGELAPMMETSASELEAENKVTTEIFLNTLEPLLIVVMGSVVGAIMIGILLPIYEMNKFV